MADETPEPQPEAPLDEAKAREAIEYLEGPDGQRIPLEVGKNCFKIIGTLVPFKDTTRVVVHCEGANLSPEEFLNALGMCYLSVLKHVQAAADKLSKKIVTADEIPKMPDVRPPFGGRR